MIALSTGRKVLSALIVAASVGVALSPVSAFAKGDHGRHGYGAAALAGGVVIGAIAAAAQDYDEEAPACWVEKRTHVDAYGDLRVTKVRVCD